MILVVAAKARMDVMDVFVRLNVSLTENLFADHIPTAKDRDEQQTLQTHIK